MCSQQEGSIPIEQLTLKDSTKFIGSSCKKCEKKADILLRRKDPLCQSCFQTYLTHKFRATLGKSRVMKPKDRVLMAFSGDQASAAMLHFVTEGQNEIARKKVVLEPLILNIQEPDFNPNYKEGKLDNDDEIDELLLRSDYSAYKINLAQVLNEELRHDEIWKVIKDKKYDTNSIDQKHYENLKKLVCNLKSLTARQDLLHHLRMKLLAKCAALLNCRKIFVADTANDLAIRIIAGLALGRGGQMSSDMGFLDERHSNVTFIRPMREILNKEIAFYNVINSVPYATVSNVATKTNLNSSIQRLTETFVNGLQADFPATISTIFRTGDKIVTNPDHNQSICIICKSKLETYESNKCCALDALVFSTNLDRLRKSCDDDTESIGCGQACSCSNKPSLSNTFKNQLCYACKIIFNDVHDEDEIPQSFMVEANTQNNRLKMKEMIADYLIEDTDVS